MKAEIAMAESVLIIDPQFKGTMAPMVDGSSVGSAISPGKPAALCANEGGADVESPGNRGANKGSL